MTNYIDLGAELREFLRMRMMEVVGEDPENLNRVELNMKEVKEQIFRLFYDYQVERRWEHIAESMARMTGIERGTTYKIRNRIRKSKR